MDNKDIVAAIMAKLRELHPELPKQARLNLELDLRRMGRRQLLRQEKSRDRDRQQQHVGRRQRERTNRQIGERESLGFADLGKGFNQGK